MSSHRMEIIAYFCMCMRDFVSDIKDKSYSHCYWTAQWLADAFIVSKYDVQTKDSKEQMAQIYNFFVTKEGQEIYNKYINDKAIYD